MQTKLTLETLDTIPYADLRRAAREALQRGEATEYVVHPSGVPGPVMVDTLVVGDRAGQVTNGDAVWGDWQAETRTILLDDRGPEGEVLVAHLDGRQVPAPVAPPEPSPAAVAEKLAGLNDTELFAESLVLLAGYPDTRAVLKLADAEWKRRGDTRFLAAMHAKGEERETARAELELGSGADVFSDRP